MGRGRISEGIKQEERGKGKERKERGKERRKDEFYIYHYL